MSLNLLCCGGPLLLASLGATGIGAIIAGVTKSWVLYGIFGVIAVFLTIMTLRKFQKGKTDCCSPTSFEKSEKSQCCIPETKSETKKETTMHDCCKHGEV
ncbi:mercury transporter [Bacillaceae bacterium C204]|uniref:mercury transporter n=1 Tax=Neobacillus sp. 204 TaxID=3383351 RepID=UPI00397DAD86